MIYIINNDYLQHYGVLGMKWGVRRYQPYSVKPRKSGKGGVEQITKIKPIQKTKDSYIIRNEKG